MTFRLIVLAIGKDQMFPFFSVNALHFENKVRNIRGSSRVSLNCTWVDTPFHKLYGDRKKSIFSEFFRQWAEHFTLFIYISRPKIFVLGLDFFHLAPSSKYWLLLHWLRWSYWRVVLSVCYIVVSNHLKGTFRNLKGSNTLFIHCRVNNPSIDNFGT